MRYIGNGKTLLAITLGISFTAWGQGGSGRAGRAAAAQQAATPQAAAPGSAAGRGGRGGESGSGGAADFYSYDTTAGSGATIPDAPPTETHQKITLNGEALAYTARAGYMPLRNATTGQSEAHLFYTSYTKDGASGAPARPVVLFLGGAPGVAAAWQEFGGLGPKRMRWMNDGTAGMPPYGWVDNPDTLLGQADLVLVHPQLGAQRHGVIHRPTSTQIVPSSPTLQPKTVSRALSGLMPQPVSASNSHRCREIGRAHV